MANDGDPTEAELKATDELAHDLLHRMLRPGENSGAGLVDVNHQIILNGLIRAAAMWLAMAFPKLDERREAIDVIADQVATGAEFFIEQGDVPQAITAQ